MDLIYLLQFVTTRSRDSTSIVGFNLDGQSLILPPE